MKPFYGQFTETLMKLTSYSKRISTATITNTDIEELQTIAGKLNQMEKAGYITESEYNILSELTFELITTGKDIVRLNIQIRQIEKDIEASRKAS